MKDLLDAFWRALAYCIHPRVIALSLLPLLIGAGLTLLFGWLYWVAAVDGVRATLESWSMLDAALQWIERVSGVASFRAVLSPLIVVMLAVPVVVVMSVLLVALLMAPAIVRLVAARRFPALERRRGAGLLGSLWVSLGSTVITLVALVVTLPLWFIPPMMLVLPPLIWGWLTYRVMSHDALAEHADPSERRELIRRHRGSLLVMGVMTGYLGAAPSLLWAVSAATLVLAPLLVPLSMWLYTLVFAFSALWFAHFALAALERMRREASAATAAIDVAAAAPDATPTAHALPPP
jgi:hypothetical protein